MSMSVNNKRTAAVLGAGPMGLAVAYELIQQGIKPVVYEADDRVGGMTASFDFSGINIERYYHFHCISDSDFLQMLQELGIEEQMNWRETKMGYWYNDQLQDWGNPVALLKFKGLGLISKIRYGLHAFYSTKINNWEKLDKIEAQGWIKKWVGKKAYDILWSKLFDYKFYDFANNLSAAWIWSRIRRIGRSRYSIFKEKLGYLEHGSDSLLSALKNYIEQNGGEIRLSTPVNKVLIDKNNNKLIGIETKLSIEKYSNIISTVPLPYVNKLIPDLPTKLKNKFDNINNIAVVCVIAKLKQAVSDKFWLNINDPDMDIPGLVEYTNLRAMGDQHIVYVPFYMPGDNIKYQDSNEIFINKVKNYIKKINNNIKDSDFIDIRASRYKFAQPICEPEFMNKLPDIKLFDGLWVADTSYYYPEDRGISESIGLGRTIARDVNKSYVEQQGNTESDIESNIGSNIEYKDEKVSV